MQHSLWKHYICPRTILLFLLFFAGFFFWCFLDFFKHCVCCTCCQYHDSTHLSQPLLSTWAHHWTSIRYNQIRTHSHAWMSNGVNNLNSVCFTKMYIYLQGNKLRKWLSSNHLVLVMDIYIYYNFWAHQYICLLIFFKRIKQNI